MNLDHKDLPSLLFFDTVPKFSQTTHIFDFTDTVWLGKYHYWSRYLLPGSKVVMKWKAELPVHFYFVQGDFRFIQWKGRVIWAHTFTVLNNEGQYEWNVEYENNYYFVLESEFRVQAEASFHVVATNYETYAKHKLVQTDNSSIVVMSLDDHSNWFPSAGKVSVFQAKL